MTTIVWDGKTLAADRRIVSGHIISVATKIRRLTDGRIVGAAGTTTLCCLWMDWLENGGDRPAGLSHSEDYINGLEILPNGEIWEHSQYGRFHNESPRSAIGSGSHVAHGAMAMGTDAYRAVEIAAQFDPGTGNGIDTLTLEPR